MQITTVLMIKLKNRYRDMEDAEGEEEIQNEANPNAVEVNRCKKYLD